MKRILVVSKLSLFNHGVASLLRDEEGLEIVGSEKDIDKALERIKDLRPDAVILDSESFVNDLMAAMMRIVRDGGGTRVITFSLQDNKMCIYCGEQRLMEDVGDLVRAIELSPCSSQPQPPDGPDRPG